MTAKKLSVSEAEDLRSERHRPISTALLVKAQRDQLAWTPRDELADLIEQAEVDWIDEREPGALSYFIADKLLAAGWRPAAHTITEASELEELPAEAVVADRAGQVLVCLGARYANVKGNVWASEHGTWLLSADLRLPAVVLRDTPTNFIERKDQTHE